MNIIDYEELKTMIIRERIKYNHINYIRFIIAF